MSIHRPGRAALRRTTAIAVAVAAAACASTPASGAVFVGTSGWAWTNPLPQGNTLTDLEFVGARGYAIGLAGTALRTDDGGSTWKGLPTGTPGALNRLQVVDQDTLTVLGNGGCLLRRSADGGATFTPIFQIQELGCDEPIAASWFVDPRTGYLLMADGSVQRTDDGGDTFARRTQIPAGGARPTVVRFSSATQGYAFAVAGETTLGFVTTDGAQSWTPIQNLPPGKVNALWFRDAQLGFAYGPQTLWRTTDGGATWESRPLAARGEITSVRCADQDNCLLTVSSGDRLLRTADGGATATSVAVSNAPVNAVAYSSATRVVAIGGGGVTVVSDDAGTTFTQLSSGIEGAYSRLRVGGTGDVTAPGDRGRIARTVNAGSSWKTLQTTTSKPIVDAVFSDANTGYALDAGGGLQRSVNGGDTWKRLDPGTSTPPNAIATAAQSTVLLVGPRGILRSTQGGRFDAVTDRDVARVAVDRVAAQGQAIVAWKSGARTVRASTDGGRAWAAVPLPRPLAAKGSKRRVEDIEVADSQAKALLLLETGGSLWRTTDRGKKWSEVTGVGRTVTSLSFASATAGFATVTGFGNDRTNGYVLRTTDGGASWAPQLIAPGSVPAGGVVATSPAAAQALVLPPGTTATTALFGTTTGGVTGAASAISLADTRKSYTAKQLKAAGGTVLVKGTLSGARGGERVVVSLRPSGGGAWREATVIAGENGGAFTATFTKVKGSSIAVAQFAGDSGRAAAGTKVLAITVKR